MSASDPSQGPARVAYQGAPGAFSHAACAALRPRDVAIPIENFEAAIGLHYAYYNFCKKHGTVKTTPAVAAGIEKSAWTVADLVESIEG